MKKQVTDMDDLLPHTSYPTLNQLTRLHYTPRRMIAKRSTQEFEAPAYCITFKIMEDVIQVRQPHAYTDPSIL